MQIKHICFQWSLFSLLMAVSSVTFAGMEIPKDWPRMKPGYIEMQSKMSGHQQTMHMCMTKEDLEQSEQNAAKENHCTIQKATRKGNQFFVDMECKNPEDGKKMQMSVESTLISENEATSKMRATQDGKPLFAGESKFKRLRDCTKEEEARSKRMATGTATSDDMTEQYKDLLGGENGEKLKELLKNIK